MTDPTTEQQLRLLGCSNNGCLIQDLPEGSVGTNAICSCYRHRSEIEIQKIFILKSQQHKALIDRLENAEHDRNLFENAMGAWKSKTDRLEAKLRDQTAFIDAYLGQPDHTKVWDSIYLTEAKLANAVQLHIEAAQLATKLQARVDQLELRIHLAQFGE